MVGQRNRFADTNSVNKKDSLTRFIPDYREKKEIVITKASNRDLNPIFPKRLEISMNSSLW